MDRNLILSKITLWGGVVVTALGGLTLNEWATIVGMFSALLGVLCTVFITWRRNVREARESEARIAALVGERRTQLRRKTDNEGVER
jgi:membrane protein implicated in regulation of membrane protease activity